MKVIKMPTAKSEAQMVYEFLKERSNKVFDIPTLTSSFNVKHKTTLCNIRISTILSRLFHKNKIKRSESQLRFGYLYSISNKDKIQEAYDNYLVPSELSNKQLIKRKILRNKFEDLSNSIRLNLDLLSQSYFFEKYGRKHFENIKTQEFLAKLVVFIMGDGNMEKSRCKFFFKEKIDAEIFIRDFKSIFQNENPRLVRREFCYMAEINGKPLAEMLHYLGAPIGNKVFQPFLVPEWVLNGLIEIKRGFLSTIYGNEGSKPQDNRWRIQFVLSKNEAFIDNLLDFLNQIKNLLANFDINASFIQLRKQKGREYHGRFYIKGMVDLRKFYKEFEFLYASEKQGVLRDLILGRNPKEVHHTQ